MIDILKTVLPSPEQWEIIVDGMRNPYDSWENSDSKIVNGEFVFGGNDLALAKKLAMSGASHAKYRRMIPVMVTINAPLYWWKEFETYKIGTVSNSSSTMHSVHKKEFSLDDFSYEHLLGADDVSWGDCIPLENLKFTICTLNQYREQFINTKDKECWWQIIQLLPSSYNQRRTISLNYEVLSNMYHQRCNHKLDEWRKFCDWITGLPYSDIITCKTRGEAI